jgi:Ricin-type beta-trefoil lectin domain-like/Ricin-type beta-trefoil lectin domain
MQKVSRPGSHRRTLPVLAAALLAALGFAAVGGATPASAATVTTTFSDQQTGLCLGTQSGSVFSAQCSGQASQQWSITPAGDPNVIITSAPSGQCLDSSYQNPVSSPVAAVVTDQCDGSFSQQWYAEPDPAQDGHLVFMNVRTGMVLDSNSGGGVYANTANGGTYQNWAVGEFPGLPPFTGGGSPATTTLGDAQTGLCLDLAGGTVGTGQCAGLASQQWTVSASGNPNVVIANKQTGQCLQSGYTDPAYPSLGSLSASSCDASLSQQWFLTGNGSGSFVLMNMLTGRMLDSNAAGAAYANTANGGNYQNWAAVELPLFPALVAESLSAAS